MADGRAVAMVSGAAAVLPRHVAIIMDGNGRWAKQRHLPRAAGHRAGVEAVRRVTRAARSLGIQALTLYAFSSENWRRPEDEIGALMGLLRLFIRSDLAEMVRDDVRLRIIGDYSRFAPDLVALLDDALARTAPNTGPILAIALNYGAQDELAAAARRLAARVRDGIMSVEAIDAEAIEAELETRELPPLDLMIRTSGEQRLSNFLLWQAAYAELLFVDTLWPDLRRRRSGGGGRGVRPASTPVRRSVSATASGDRSDLAMRVVTGAGLAAVAILALVAGGLLFWLLAVVASLLMMAEWADLHGATARQKRTAQFALSVPLAIMAPASLILETRNFFVLGLLAGAAFFIVIVTRRQQLGRELALGVLYCGLPVLALTLIRRQHAPGTESQAWGLVWAIWAMALVWMTDIGAYAAGRVVGRAQAVAGGQPQEDLGGADRRRAAREPVRGPDAQAVRPAAAADGRDAGAGGAGAGRRPLRELAQAARRGEGFGQSASRARRRPRST